MREFRTSGSVGGRGGLPPGLPDIGGRVAPRAFVPGGPRQIRTRRFPPSGSSVGSVLWKGLPKLDAYPRGRQRKSPQDLIETFPAQAPLAPPS